MLWSAVSLVNSSGNGRNRKTCPCPLSSCAIPSSCPPALPPAPPLGTRAFQPPSKPLQRGAARGAPQRGGDDVDPCNGIPRRADAGAQGSDHQPRRRPKRAVYGYRRHGQAGEGWQGPRRRTACGARPLIGTSTEVGLDAELSSPREQTAGLGLQCGDWSSPPGVLTNRRSQTRPAGPRETVEHWIFEALAATEDPASPSRRVHEASPRSPFLPVCSGWGVSMYTP